LGQVSPGTETVSYDESSRTISWNIGTLASGSGFDAVAKEVSVQLALTPSIGQVGNSPILLGNITFNGTDAFTEVPVKTVTESITTKISTDPTYVQGDEMVTK
jgi:hypothetical protein